MIMNVNSYKKYKVLIIGNANVGKTSLLLRHADGVYNDTVGMPTLGVDFKVKSYFVKAGGQDVRRDLHIFDTAGQERFRSITRVYFREAHGVFLVFDLNDTSSFEALGDWIAMVQAEVHPVFVLIGNKADLPHNVTPERIQEFTKKYHIGSYIETSAKANNNVDKMFDILLSKLVINEAGAEAGTEGSTIRVTNQCHAGSFKKGQCC
jgi:small GTP-binding protein